MGSGKNILIGILVSIVLVLIYSSSTYNGFVQEEQQIEAQWAQVETQLQRRYDLIPNLVSSTKGLMKQEQQVFGDLAKARQAYTGASGVNERVEASGQMESALGRLLAIVENYPDLKSNQAVLALMDEVSGSENRISTQRVRYNESVRAYNTHLLTFPARLIASYFGFESKQYFEVSEPAAKTPPKVEF